MNLNDNADTEFMRIAPDGKTLAMIDWAKVENAAAVARGKPPATWGIADAVSVAVVAVRDHLQKPTT